MVPVFNPGPHIEGLIASLRRQSLPPEHLETIFVDDGSTDGTGPRLDRLAASAPGVRVLHVPRSGWPGRPRNVGIDAARGEYIQFADDDDELADEALERLHRYATAHRSDVVVGREVRTGVAFPYGMRLFADNHPRITLDDPRLLGPLSPHKMFRRQFLLDHGIRFPESPRIFEDHAFVMEAYLAADVISVLSDYPCYRWKRRDDSSSAGSASRGRGFADTIDVITRRTDPGPLRDQLLADWYQRRVLKKAGPRWAAAPADGGSKSFRRWQGLAERYFPEQLDTRLPPLMRVRSALLRSGDIARLRALAAQHIGLHQGSTTVRLHSGTVEVTAEVWLRYADGTPLVAEPVDGRLAWLPPIDLGDAVAGDALDVTAALDDARLEIIARRRDCVEDVVLLPVPATAIDRRPGSRRLGAAGQVRFDAAATLAAGTWDLYVALSVAGWDKRAALRSPHASQRTRLVRHLLVGDDTCRVHQTRRGTISITVRSAGRARGSGSPVPGSMRTITGKVRRTVRRVWARGLP